MKFMQYLSDRRKGSSVPFQLDNSQIVQIGFHPCQQVAEMYSRVYGQPFGHRLIHQCNPMETVFKQEFQDGQLIPGVIAEKLFTAVRMQGM